MEKVSVLLTTYNDGFGVRRVLDYIDENEKYVNDFIIVSDACKDETEDTINKWMNKSKPFFIDFNSRKDRHGRADSIRYGLKRAKKDVVVIFAGDIEPINESFHNLVNYFKDPKVGAVTGHPNLINGTRTIADCLAHIMWDSHDNVGRITTEQGVFFHLNGEMFAIRKSALKGFDDYYGIAEDAMIGHCIYKNGYSVRWAEDVSYLMQYPESLGEWLKIRKRCCYGRVEIAHKTGLLDYPFYELSHLRYLKNILSVTLGNWRFMLALPLGALLELLCRFYYLFMYPIIKTNREYLLKTLWEPSGETKW